MRSAQPQIRQLASGAAGEGLQTDDMSSMPDTEIVTIRGREYAVVPVVALVEGVRWPRGADQPELVTSEAFGRYVGTWDGRPIVVDHPVDDNGEPCLASTPGILEKYYMGVMYQCSVSKGKLLTYAYLDLEAIAATDSEPVVDMWERLLEGETVEVSVGAIVHMNRNVSGTFKGKKYKGRWDIVIPDHLAFLSNAKGACSIEDGCGTFRTQSMGGIHLSEGMRMMAKQEVGRLRQLAASEKGRRSPKGKVRTAGGECKCRGTETPEALETELEPVEESEGVGDAGDTGTTGDDIGGRVEETGRAMSRMLFGEQTYDVDRRALLVEALQTLLGRNSYPYVLTYSGTDVVYMTYSVSDDVYRMYQMTYTSTADDTVTLSGKAVEVRQKTTFVAKGTAAQTATTALEAVTECAAGGDVETTVTEERTMSGDKTVSVPKTLDELMKMLTDGGSPLAGVLDSTLKTAESARKTVTARILATAAGKAQFDEAMLAPMSFETLERMAKALEMRTAGADEGGGGGARRVADMNSPEELDAQGGGGDASRALYAGRQGGERGQRADDNKAPAPLDIFPRSTAA